MRLDTQRQPVFAQAAFFLGIGVRDLLNQTQSQWQFEIADLLPEDSDDKTDLAELLPATDPADTLVAVDQDGSGGGGVTQNIVVDGTTQEALTLTLNDDLLKITKVDTSST